jgi:hypothetical protein
VHPKNASTRVSTRQARVPGTSAQCHLVFRRRVFGGSCGAAFSGCGSAFRRVQPAGRPAAATNGHPTANAEPVGGGKLSGIGHECPCHTSGTAARRLRNG